MDEIGQKLRDARLEKGYTIDDLQQITKIQKRYLLAIEEGNFDALPGDFYVRAFIKQYASVVGLDPDALMEQYQQDIPSVKPVVPNDEEETTDDGKGSVIKQTRVAPGAQQARNSRVRRYLPQIIIGAIVVVLLVVVYSLTIAQQRRDSKPSIPADRSSVSVQKSSKKSTKSTSSKTKSSSSSSSASSSSSSSKKKSTKKSSKSKGLSISKPNVTASNAQTYTVKNLPSTSNTIEISTTTAAAWTSVTIDGTTSWQGTITAGGKQSVTVPAGAKSIVVKSGNATVSAIKINNKKVNMGSSTSLVRTLTFTVQ